MVAAERLSAAATSKFPTLSAVRDRNRYATILAMILRYLIPQQHRPILGQVHVRSSCDRDWHCNTSI